MVALLVTRCLVSPLAAWVIIRVVIHVSNRNALVDLVAPVAVAAWMFFRMKGLCEERILGLISKRNLFRMVALCVEDMGCINRE